MSGTGPADDANVDQEAGTASGVPGTGTGDGSDTPQREVGVRAAVERGPGETVSEPGEVDDQGEPRQDREPARRTDDR